MIDTSSHVYLTEHILKHSLDLICTLNLNGQFVYVNNACEKILGYTPHYLAEKPVTDFIHPSDKDKEIQIRKEILSNKTSVSYKNRFISLNNQEITICWSVTWSEEEQIFLCIGRDISEQVLVKSKVQEKEVFYQALIEHGSDMLALLDEEGNFKYLSKSYLKILGYEPESLIGLNALSLIHPEDVHKAVASLEKVQTQEEHVLLSDFRYKNANGEWKWLETIGSNQLHNPSINSIVISSRDVTEPVISKLKLSESEQRFKALFENNPDMVHLESTEGIILDANPAVLSYYGIKKEDIVGKPMTAFLTDDAAVICDQKRLEALNGERVNFDLAMEVVGFENLGNIILEISKVPVEINGEITGLYTISRDITAARNSQNTIKQLAKKLSNIFESITDAFFTLDKDWNFTYINTESERLLDINRDESVGQNILDVFPEELNGKFHKKYLYAFATGNSVKFEAFLERTGRWLDVRAFPYNEGLSVYFADITERVRIEQELEKLSLVASTSTNGIFITDANRRIEWANDGFTRLTGYTLDEVRGKRPSEVLHNGKTATESFNSAKKKIIEGEAVSFEVLYSAKNGDDVWVSAEVNPVLNEEGKLSSFISTLTDITLLKKSELELTQLTKDLYRHNRDMQQFTYIVSHNLRSPVANAIGMTQLLNKLDKNSPVFTTALNNLNKCVTQLDAMLNDLNTILSVRDIKESFEKEEVAIYHVLQQVMLSLQEPLEKCSGKLITDIPVNHSISGNRAYLHSIFYNLLSNAIKYKSPDRSLEVQISCSTNESGETVIAISDNGSGIDMPMVGNKLFKLYNRFHAGTTEGRGIGLFLVKTHIEALGGRIEVDSEVNVGTTFTIYIL